MAQIRVEPLMEELHSLLKATLRAAVILLHKWLNPDLGHTKVQEISCLSVSTLDPMIDQWGDHSCGTFRFQIRAVSKIVFCLLFVIF